MSYRYETPDTEQPTPADVRTAIKRRIELTAETTKAEVVVDVADDHGIAQHRVKQVMDELMRRGEIYDVGDGADAEVKVT